MRISLPWILKKLLKLSMKLLLLINIGLAITIDDIIS